MQRRVSIAGGVAFALAAIVSLAVWFLAKEASGQTIPYLDTSAVERGAIVYAQNCASCHGADMSGQDNWRAPDQDGYLPAPPHDPSGHTWHHPDTLLIDIVTKGTEAVVGRGYQSRMIGFGDTLSHADILAVLAYIKSSWPAAVIDTHNDINARFAE